jgi:polar amino acid transport system substrate-binding protein
MIMKKLSVLLLVAALLLAVLPAGAENADNSLQDILDKGKLVLGLDASFPPMGFTDPDTGAITGFDIDLAAEVCKRLGVELITQPIEWVAKEMELNAGNIDCIWNGMTITPERLENMAISLPYLENSQVVVVKADSGIASLADMAGKKLGLQAGSSANDALDAAVEFKESLAEVVPFDENVTALLDLNNGGIDGVLVDIVVANYYTKVNDYPFIVLEEALAPEQYGIGFRKADLALCDKVNELLLEMRADGSLANISTAWFDEDITIIGQE